jgi:hypothetical protein
VSGRPQRASCAHRAPCAASPTRAASIASAFPWEPSVARHRAKVELGRRTPATLTSPARRRPRCALRA